MIAHLAIAPILIPLAIAALQLLLNARRRLRALLSVLSCLLLLATAAGLMAVITGAAGADSITYNLGGWPPRFAIVLVVDRLSALMLLLTAVLALAVMPSALGRWQYKGAHFQ